MHRSSSRFPLGPGFAAAVLAALLAVPAAAQQATPHQRANVSTPAQTATDPGTPAVTEAGTTANGRASTEAQTRLQQVMERARSTPQTSAAPIEKQLAVDTKKVDAEAAGKGDATVAERLATEFGMTPESLSSEKTRLQAGWGDLMIAHTLVANSKMPVTVDDLFQMRTEGLGWGQIANGLNLRMGEVTGAAKAETRVATGLAKPDGKPARIATAASHAAHRSGTSVASSTHSKMSAAAGTGAEHSATQEKAGK